MLTFGRRHLSGKACILRALSGIATGLLLFAFSFWTKTRHLFQVYVSGSCHPLCLHSLIYQQLRPRNFSPHEAGAGATMRGHVVILQFQHCFFHSTGPDLVRREKSVPVHCSLKLLFMRAFPVKCSFLDSAIRYTTNGILHMLDRNRRIKPRPERFQTCCEKFDIIVSCEERVYDQILEGKNRRQSLPSCCNCASASAQLTLNSKLFTKWRTAWTNGVLFDLQIWRAGTKLVIHRSMSST